MEFTIAANKETEVNSGLQPGIYFVWASTAQGRWVEKIVVRN